MVNPTSICGLITTRRGGLSLTYNTHVWYISVSVIYEGYVAAQS